MMVAGTAGAGKVLRAFIAIPLPAPCQQALARRQQHLQPQLPGVRWTRPESIHLTLAFLGSVPEENLEKITAVMLSVGLAFAPFVLMISGVGAFPSWRHPRVVWAGINGGPQLGALQAALTAGLVPLGYPGEERSYLPHLTLGRCRSGVSWVAPAIGKTVEESSVLPVDRLILYESRLQAAGACHIPLITQYLGCNGGADESVSPAGA